MRRFFIRNIPENHSEILVTGMQANHLKNVLRMKKDSQLILLDGSGIEYKGEIKEFLGQDVIISILEIIKAPSPEPSSIAVGFGFLKESKVDDLIRPLTELGISEIIPFISERSISRPAIDKINKKMERWNKIASESIKQCKRTKVPTISFCPSFDEIINHSKGYTKKIFFYEKDRSSSLIEDYMNSGCMKPDRVFILIGPEGGFSEREADLAMENGFESFSLSRGILRAETAVVTSVGIVQYIYNI